MTEQQFKILFDKYNSNLIGFSYVMIKDLDECENIVQNAYMKLWEIGGVENPNQWLHKCVRNECLNFIKHEKVKTREHNLILKYSIPYVDILEIKSEVIIRIAKEIESLHGQQKKIAKLLSLGYAQVEIAEILNLQPSTVGVQIMRIRKYLKPILTNE